MAGLKIVVVGGAATGPKAAARARRLDPQAEITLLEKGDYISCGVCGLPYLVSGEIPELQDLLTTPEGVVWDAGFFGTVKNIQVLTGREVTAIDRSRKQVRARDRATSREESYPYDKLVLATGATPLRPKVPGIDLENVFPLRLPEDALEIRRALMEARLQRAVVLGAGAIGLEVAGALAQRGLEVTVLEALEEIMPALDKEMGRLLRRYLETQGVRCLTGEKVTSLVSDDQGRVEKLYTDKGEYPAQLVVMAVGSRPNVELARLSGLELGGTGAIAVDETLCTSDPDVYAGGDCVESFHRLLGRPVVVSSGQLANIHGRIIGTNVTGGRATFKGTVGTVIARVLECTVGATGLTEAQARREGLEVATALVPGFDRAHYYPGAEVVGLKMVVEAPTRRLLGLQVVGPGDGAKRLDIAATALHCQATVDDLVQLNLGYAPPYATAIDLLINAAQVVENKLAGVAQALSPLEVQELTARGEDFVLLDVRTPQEFKAVRLKHPKAFIVPLGKLREKAAQLPQEKLFIPFCQFSQRGYEAQKILEGLGFKKVKFLDGGVAHWPYELEK
jgi:NADPH-dependent 2,4-dienoyl-CoA reductase/sulfur reductase-like enzyme/rhodanese-related sulfurtransferase